MCHRQKFWSPLATRYTAFLEAPATAGTTERDTDMTGVLQEGLLHRNMAHYLQSTGCLLSHAAHVEWKLWCGALLHDSLLLLNAVNEIDTCRAPSMTAAAPALREASLAKEHNASAMMHALSVKRSAASVRRRSLHKASCPRNLVQGQCHKHLASKVNQHATTCVLIEGL